jgi:hypothetical protein
MRVQAQQQQGRAGAVGALLCSHLAANFMQIKG